MKLKHYLYIAAAAIFIALCTWADIQTMRLRAAVEERDRLAVNQTSLLTEMELREKENGALIAEVQALTLRADELETLVPKYEAKVKELGIKVRDLQSISEMQLRIIAEIEARRDTVFLPAIVDTMGNRSQARYWFQDAYLTAAIDVVDSTLAKLHVEASDTLTVVAHRKPVKCLFKRKGKIVKYTVESSSPYTKIQDVKYIEVVD